MSQEQDNSDPVDQDVAGASAPTSARDSKGRFPPGVSGNPTGQKRGYAAKVRMQLQTILDEPATPTEQRTKLEILLRALYAKAVKGDMVATRLILERVLPATFEADISAVGMQADQVLDVIACLGEDYVQNGRLPLIDPDR